MEKSRRRPKSDRQGAGRDPTGEFRWSTVPRSKSPYLKSRPKPASRYLSLSPFPRFGEGERAREPVFTFPRFWRALPGAVILRQA